MNSVEKLIEELCPLGVEYFKLNEIADFSNNGIDKKIKENEVEVGLLNFKDVFSLSKIESKDISAKTTVSNDKKENVLIKKNDIYITPSSEVKDEIGMSSVVAEDIPNTVYSYHIARIRIKDFDQVNPYFLSYLFYSSSIRNQINENSQGMTRYGLTKPKWENLRFPIPPLKIQNEIVNILDKFTELEAKLEAELQARKKQYDYYSKEILIFDNNVVPFENLSNLYDFQYGMGNTIPKIGGTYPIYGSNGIVGTHNEFNSENAPVIGHIGAYAGIVNWAAGKHFVTYNGVICKIRAGHDSRFGYHLLRSLNLRELANAGSQPFVSYEMLRNVQVQIPKKEVQKRIADLLDDFECFTSDISSGLPAEIKARRQQYEYYREKLLTFKELKSA